MFHIRPRLDDNLPLASTIQRTPRINGALPSLLRKRIVAQAALLSTLLTGLILPRIVYGDCIDYNTFMHQVGSVSGLTGYDAYTVDVAIYGTYGYVTGANPLSFRGSVFVIDISDPTSPSLVNTVGLSGRAFGLAISGSYLYVANEFDGLKIYSLSTPASPTLIGSIDTPGYAYDVAVSGPYAYVADAGSGLQVVDISNPVSPSIVGSVDTPGLANGIDVSGSHVFVADEAGGLEAIDVSNPAAPSIVGTLSTPVNAHGVTVSGDHAYVADNGFGLRVVEITNPASLAIVGSVKTPASSSQSDSGPYGVAVDGSLAFVADGFGGLQVADISDPGSPAIVGALFVAGGRSVAVSGSYAYVAGAGLAVIDISNPTSPPYVGSAQVPITDLTVTGTYAYVAGGSFQVIDISDPSAPTVVGTAGFPIISAAGVAVSGSYAYVTDPSGYDPDFTQSGQLRIIDISNPASPTLVGSVHSTGGKVFSSSPLSGVAVSGDYVYIACPDGNDPLMGPGSLQVVDVSRPTGPSTVATVPVPEFPCYSVAISGPYAYVTGWKETIITYPVFSIVATTGLRVIDISHPTSPVIVGNLTLTGSEWYQMAVGGTYLYVAGSPGLRVIDVANPASPSIVATNLGSSRDVAIQGSYAYLSGGTEIRIVDIHNPLSPTTKGPLGYLSGGTSAVATNSSFLFVSGELTGDLTTRGPFLFPLQCSVNSPCLVQAAAMDVDPNTIALAGNGNSVTAHIELPAGYDPAQIVLNTVRLNGTVVPSSTSLDIKDWNHNHIPDLEVKFSRDAMEASLQEGDQVPVTVTGDIEGGCSFTGTVTVRVIRPHLSHPNGGETYLAGASTLVSWENPTGRAVSYAQLYSSPDGGDSWGLVADHVLGTSYEWAMPQEPTQNGRLRVFVLDDQGVMGYDSSDGSFVIGSATGVGDVLPTVHRLYQNSPNPFAAATRAAFDLPVEGRVTLEVFDLTGRKVRALADDWYPAGKHDISWDGRDAVGRSLAGGIYFLHMKSGSFSDTKRMYLRR
jgi:hypothetical protein